MSKKTEIICGKNAVIEVLKSGSRVCHELFYAEGKKEQLLDEMLKLARKNQIRCTQVAKSEIAKLSRVEKHQGVAARVDAFRYTDLATVLGAADEKRKFLLMLDGILDPQNLGSLIRTAHQVGVQGVLLSKDNSAPVGPAATRAAAGATEHQAVVQVTNLSSTLKSLKEKGFWVYGAEGSEQSKSLYDLEFADDNVVLVLGAEGKGIRRLVKDHCDFLLAIPMSGKIDSFNVSVAGGIIMAEIQRQRSCFSVKKP